MKHHRILYRTLSAPLPWTLRPADRLRQETRSQARLLRAVRTVRVEKGL